MNMAPPRASVGWPANKRLCVTDLVHGSINNDLAIPFDAH
jgi:hypothetical protein